MEQQVSLAQGQQEHQGHQEHQEHQEHQGHQGHQGHQEHQEHLVQSPARVAEELPPSSCIRRR